MNYVGMCFYTDIGRCLCGSALSSGSTPSTAHQSNPTSLIDLSLITPVASQSVATAPTASTVAGRQGNNAIYSSPSRSFGSSIFDFSSSSGTSQSYSGGGSGGAPTPEVNASLALLLAGGILVFLRRRRNHQVRPAA